MRTPTYLGYRCPIHSAMGTAGIGYNTLARGWLESTGNGGMLGNFCNLAFILQDAPMPEMRWAASPETVKLRRVML